MNNFKLFVKANKFPYEITKNYWKFASTAEKIFDFLVPAILTCIVWYFIKIMDPEPSTVLKGIKDINSQSLTFISILAGFNVASISVLATASSKLLENLKKMESRKHSGTSLFEIMMTFFCASIILQFFIILVGVMILVISSVTNLPPDFPMNIYMWILVMLWIYALITSIFVSIRNLKTLFYILVNNEH
ncbi:hypothetical protein [Bacillus thuringiensis]|uniref:hypothetical protein n=1 Tax=Bacillus thuringiensis TaxID=1428 RepID=UPI0021B42F8F|nr:hypothetical protein [Bacillus thuringiensis]